MSNNYKRFFITPKGRPWIYSDSFYSVVSSHNEGFQRTFEIVQELCFIVQKLFLPYIQVLTHNRCPIYMNRIINKCTYTKQYQNRKDEVFIEIFSSVRNSIKN